MAHVIPGAPELKETPANPVSVRRRPAHNVLEASIRSAKVELGLLCRTLWSLSLELRCLELKTGTLQGCQTASAVHPDYGKVAGILPRLDSTVVGFPKCRAFRPFLVSKVEMGVGLAWRGPISQGGWHLRAYVRVGVQGLQPSAHQNMEIYYKTVWLPALAR